MNYDSKTEFVIDLDDVWKWIGFNQKFNAKRLLEKSFVIDTDYKNLVIRQEDQYKKHGGHNKEKIMLTINAFKRLCLKAGTKKADQIHEYYIKLEELLHESVNEESNELKLQLQNQKQDSVKEKEILLEKTLLEQFPKNCQCIYYGKIDDKSITGETLIKFGNSNNLAERVEVHKKTYTNFRLTNAFKVSNKIHMENELKKDPNLKKKRRNILIDNVNYTELLAIDNLSYEEIDQKIKQIITETEYNIENYTRLLERNAELEKENTRLVEEIEKVSAKAKESDDKLTEILPVIGHRETKLQKMTFAGIPKQGFLLFAFECKENRYKCGISRIAAIDNREQMYKDIDSNGEIKYTHKIYYPVFERVVSFLLRHRLTKLGNDTYEGTLHDIKTIFEIVAKMESKVIIENLSLEEILKSFDVPLSLPLENTLDPEVPISRKAKRAIDQIHPETGKLIASYPSIEAAGRMMGLTSGTAIGIALRNKTLCKGFIWRYAGISKDDQYSDQAVIKICCSTGEQTNFANMADAARDARISAPGIRNRILTKVHIDDFHWIFDKTATHYT